MPKVFASRSQIVQVYCIDRCTLTESARRLNMSHMTLSRYLDRFGIPRRGISEAKKGTTLSEVHRNKVVKSLRQFNT